MPTPAPLRSWRAQLKVLFIQSDLKPVAHLISSFKSLQQSVKKIDEF